MSSFDVAGLPPCRFGACRRDRIQLELVLVVKIKLGFILVFVRLLVLLVHAGDEQAQELFESALGGLVLELPVVEFLIVKLVEVGAVLHRRAAQGLSIHLHAVDVLSLAVQIVKFGLVEVRLRALPAKETLRRGFLRRISILVERVLRIDLLVGMLRAPARGDVVLHAMEEANEGIKGVRILIFLFRELRFVIHGDLIVHRGGFIEIFLGDEILCGPGAILPARGLGRIGLLCQTLRLNRLGGGGFNRPGRLHRLRSLRRLHRLARAGLVLLVSATELVVIQFRAVVSGIAHSVTASHCTKRMHGISIRFYYTKIPIF